MFEWMGRGGGGIPFFLFFFFLFSTFSVLALNEWVTWLGAPGWGKECGLDFLGS